MDKLLAIVLRMCYNEIVEWQFFAKCVELVRGFAPEYLNERKRRRFGQTAC